MFFRAEQQPRDEEGRRVPPPEHPRCKKCSNVADGFKGGVPYCASHLPQKRVVH